MNVGRDFKNGAGCLSVKFVLDGRWCRHTCSKAMANVVCPFLHLKVGTGRRRAFWTGSADNRQMEFSNERIGEFIDHWEHAFGESLSGNHAHLIAGRVLTLYRQLVRPLPLQDFQDIGDMQERD